MGVEDAKQVPAAFVQLVQRVEEFSRVHSVTGGAVFGVGDEVEFLHFALGSGQQAAGFFGQVSGEVFGKDCPLGGSEAEQGADYTL